MTYAPDVADDLRIDDRFLSRVPADRWPKPISVALRGSSRKVLLRDLVKNGPLPREPSHLVIESPTPNSWNNAAYVRPPANLLESFMKLSGVTNERVRDFCERYGGLYVFCELGKDEQEESLTVTEFCDVWRYFAGSMRALLRIAAKLDHRPLRSQEDWDWIGEVPPIIKKRMAEGREHWDPFSPAQFQGEHAWAVMAYFVKKSDRDRNKQMWARLLNTLLGLGRVRPLVLWDRETPDVRPIMAYGTPSLMSYLALQVCLLSVRREAFVVCFHCNQEYVPSRRAPKAGQRNFCPDCRARKIPNRLAQRDRRARRRAPAGSL